MASFSESDLGRWHSVSKLSQYNYCIVCVSLEKINYSDSELAHAVSKLVQTTEYSCFFQMPNYSEPAADLTPSSQQATTNCCIVVLFQIASLSESDLAHAVRLQLLQAATLSSFFQIAIYLQSDLTHAVSIIIIIDCCIVFLFYIGYSESNLQGQ